MTSLAKIILLSCFAAGTLIGCGVKSAPTPVLDTPPSILQQEANKRASEAAEKAKKKETKKP